MDIAIRCPYCNGFGKIKPSDYPEEDCMPCKGKGITFIPLVKLAMEIEEEIHQDDNYAN